MVFVSAPLQITALVCASGLVAVYTDLRSRRIPNWLSGLLLISGLAIHTSSAGLPGFTTAIMGALCCCAAFLPFYIVGGMGAGDVKLITAEGCLLGFTHSLSFVIATALCGAALALAIAVKNRSLRVTMRATNELAVYHLKSGLIRHPSLSLLSVKAAHVPYALAISSGALIVTLFDNLGQGYR